MSSSQASEFRYLVRIKGKDLDGRKKVVSALADLRGIGYNFAQAIVNGIGIDPKVRFGTLTESQVKDIERVLLDTSSLKVPQWAFNRKRDPESGETKQLIGSDLDMAVKSDVERERNVQSWRGVRHGLGLKVRGQRTRTTGRKGKTVGVRKATLQAAAKAAKASDDKK
ncbi:MAG: 30S ribosomal protein S13 [Thaumarchaeota archaeon]|nr:30S ribosomal protein S13 [Nitrososphaerota archaeon]